MYSVQICPVMKWEGTKRHPRCTIQSQRSFDIRRRRQASSRRRLGCRDWCRKPKVYKSLPLKSRFSVCLYIRPYIYIHKFFKCMCVFFRERESYADVGSIPRCNVSMHAHTFPCTHHHTHTLFMDISATPFFSKS
jgi:hypothetical protein